MHSLSNIRVHERNTAPSSFTTNIYSYLYAYYTYNYIFIIFIEYWNFDALDIYVEYFSQPDISFVYI